MNRQTSQTVLSNRLPGLALLISLGLAGCGGSDGELVLNTQVAAGNPEMPQVNVLNDQSDTVADNAPSLPPVAIENDASFFEFASLLLTEPGKLWTCRISGDDFASTDRLLLNRNGTGRFDAYGDFYWNRDLPGRQLQIAVPGVIDFRLANIFGFNTTAQFDLLRADPAVLTAYDLSLIHI